MKIFDATKALKRWEERTEERRRWYGRKKRVSCATGRSSWHDVLYLSSRSTYYVIRTMDTQSPGDWSFTVELTKSDAALWLQRNGYDPEEHIETE